MFTDLMQLDDVNRLGIQLVGKLHQAGKIHNLHQVCGVFGCDGVNTLRLTSESSILLLVKDSFFRLGTSVKISQLVKKIYSHCLCLVF